MKPSGSLQKALVRDQHRKNSGASSHTRSTQVLLPSDPPLARSGPASRTRSSSVTEWKNDTVSFLAAGHITKSLGPASRTRSSTLTTLMAHHRTKSTDLAITKATDTHDVMSASSSLSWKEVSSCLDNTLMKDGFIDHLCLVRINPLIPPDFNPKANHTRSCDKIVEEFKLWPAMKFESLKELMGQIRRLPLPDPERICASFSSEYKKQVQKNITTMTGDKDLSPKSYGVVYLLGRGRLGHPPLVILEKESGRHGLLTDDINLFCFEDHLLEMAGASGEHCGSKGFQDAFNLAVKRTEICVYSEKKCFDVEYSDLARQKMKKRRTSL